MSSPHENTKSSQEKHSSFLGSCARSCKNNTSSIFIRECGAVTKEQIFRSTRKSRRKGKKFKPSDRPRKKYSLQSSTVSEKSMLIKSPREERQCFRVESPTLFTNSIVVLLDSSSSNRKHSQFDTAIDRNNNITSFKKSSTNSFAGLSAKSKNINKYHACQTSHNPLRESQSRRFFPQQLWCHVWVIIGLLCKETAVTALGVCIVWDIHETFLFIRRR